MLKRIKSFPVVLIGVGILELLNNLHIINFGFSKYWPIILILIGLVLVYNSMFE